MTPSGRSRGSTPSYVTLPGAAWDAMLRHSARKTPIHLITDEQAYKDVRSSVMGGLSCIFQQANNPELGEEDYNPEEPLNFNAMYPAAMTRLSWLHETCLSEPDAKEVSYLLLWTTTSPRSCMNTWTGLPPHA